MSENNNKGNTILLTIIGVATLLIAVVGATFAYFSAQIMGDDNDEATPIQIKSGTLMITYDGGPDIKVPAEDGSTSAIYPRGLVADYATLDTVNAWAHKTFTITGNITTNDPVPYALTMKVNLNTFNDDSLTFRLIPSGDNSTFTDVVTNGKLPTTGNDEGSPTVQNVSLGAAQFNGSTQVDGKTEDVHTYDLYIYYPETGGDQSTEQGKKFKAHIVVDTQSSNLYD